MSPLICVRCGDPDCELAGRGEKSHLFNFTGDLVGKASSRRWLADLVVWGIVRFIYTMLFPIDRIWWSLRSVYLMLYVLKCSAYSPRTGPVLALMRAWFGRPLLSPITDRRINLLFLSRERGNDQQSLHSPIPYRYRFSISKEMKDIGTNPHFLSGQLSQVYTRALTKDFSGWQSPINIVKVCGTPLKRNAPGRMVLYGLECSHTFVSLEFHQGMKNLVK